MQPFGQSHPLQPVSNIKLHGFCGFSVAWSPFYPDQLAIATSANFGLVGNGKLVTLQSRPPNNLNPSSEWLTQDGLYDLAWSEANERQIATCSGDGSVKLWDLSVKDGLPVSRWKEHQGEVHALDWSNLQKDLFLTAGSDQTLKLWNPSHPQSLQSAATNHGNIYGAAFNPHEPHLAASCHLDGSVLLTDFRTAGRPALTFRAHDAEVLSLDWNKYRPMTLATGSVDRSIRIHDLRAPLAVARAQSSAAAGQTSSNVSAVLMGHQFAVRKIAWSPHSAELLASASYDLSARLWRVGEVGAGRPEGHVEVARHEGHTEFVVGAAWSLFEPGLLATCSWDQTVHLLKGPV